MAVRSNILTNTTARAKYIQGVKLLKKEFTGPTTKSLGIPGLPSRSAPTIYSWFGIIWP